MQQSISKFFAVRKPQPKSVESRQQQQSRSVSDRGVESQTIQSSQLSTSPVREGESVLSKRLSSRVSESSAKVRRILLSNGKIVDKDSFDADDDMEDDDIDEQINGSCPPISSPLVAKAKVVYTPLEKQVMAIKERYPDSLLMVECGYRMRFFGEDAGKAAAILGVWAHMDHNFMVASVPTFRAVFHCRRLLFAGVKVAIVRQTETAAIRKGAKGSGASTSQTFERNVVGVFTAGTLIDDDDPAFDSLAQTTGRSDNKGGDDDDEMDEDDGEEGSSGNMDSHAIRDTLEDDRWVSSYYEVSSAFGNFASLVSVCVRAHEVLVRTFPLDSKFQALTDNLILLKPSEIVFAKSISKGGREIISNYFPGSVQPIGAGKIMQGTKIVNDDIYRKSLPSGDTGLLWSISLSSVAQHAVRGMYHYLSEFQLTSALSNPHVTVSEELMESGTESTGDLVDLTGHMSQPDKTISHTKSYHRSNATTMGDSFLLDSVTVRDLEIFDGLSNANDQLKGISKLRQYQQSSGGSILAALERGGLYQLLNQCISIYGRRTLRQWLLNPLNSCAGIRARQDVIAWFLGERKHEVVSTERNGRSTTPERSTMAEVQLVRSNIQETLRRLPDIEKMLASLQFNRISPPRLRTMLLLGGRLQTLCFSEDVLGRMPTLLRQWLTKVDLQTLATTSATYAQQISLSDTAHPQKQRDTNDSTTEDVLTESLTGFFTSARENDFPALAALRSEKLEAVAKMQEELQCIRNLLRKPHLQFTSLRTGAVSQLEHLVELPIREESIVPATWLKVSSTKQVVRYHVPSVLQVQDVLYRIRDECKLAGQEAWRLFASEAKAAVYVSLRSAITILGQLDAIMSLSIVASYPGYVRPVYRDIETDTEKSGPEESDQGRRAASLTIRQARHPVLERIMSLSTSTRNTPYLPNDVHLDTSVGLPDDVIDHDRRICQIVTGPNMGGKSTYCRMVALLAIMGQIGAYLPAESAEMVVFDNILTRMGSEDDLQSGRSTFLCELTRTNTILRHATSRSLVLIDELGRGTATHDGCAIAQATLQYLVRHIRCTTLFITHFPQIATAVAGNHRDSTQSDLARHCMNTHMSYVTQRTATGDDEITFLYKLVETPSQGSYGINVARLAGIKKSVLDRALVKAQEMLMQQPKSV